jgi:N-acetylglucosamine-6-sulfatase
LTPGCRIRIYDTRVLTNILNRIATLPRLTQVLLLVAPTLVLVVVGLVLALRPTAGPVNSARPNFVFIFTDDMRKDDLAYMPKTRDLLGSHGMTFENAYIPLASCCPSRASVLRGQYVHNHKVWYSPIQSNIGGYKGWVAQGHENDNLATHLQAGGYHTGLFGKYMNGYKETTGKPPGWTDWFAKNGGSGYFDYSVNDNGVDKNFGSAPEDYFMDVLNTESRQFIQQSVTAGKPFFLYLSPNVPHEPSTPAPRHVSAFGGERAPSLPSYNEANVSDKPPWISSLPSISSTEAADIQRRHENRVEGLQSVDEAVQDVVNTLSATGQLGNTYIVFTSDNGWQHGEHRIAKHKEVPYEESSHMPLLIRGPGVAAGSTTDKLVTFPDFMPTFLELGGIARPSYIDGRSLVPVLNGTATSWRTAVLLEGRNTRFAERDYFAIRTAAGEKYIEYASGFKEYYNLASDPYEMISTPGSASAALVDRLQRLKACAAATCRSIENEDNNTPPRVLRSTVPADGATGVSPTVIVKAAFSEDMDPATINGNTFEVFREDSTTKLAATVISYDATDTATLEPRDSLQSGVTYKAVVTTGAKELAGNPLNQNTTKTGAQQKAWFFTVL